MTPFDLEPEVFLADAVGTPGKRVFYIQVRGDFGALSFLLEKGQVAVLAERLRDMLVLIDGEDSVRGAVPARDPALVIEEPVEPEWRIGTIGIAFDDANDRIVMYLHPTADEAEQQGDEEQEVDDAEAAVRFTLRRDQVRAFVLHTIAVVSEGRPICQLCGLPMDPEGHNCPASNGHRPSE
jgi:uncharacterized repeat protein (TIGR03847 family)